VSRILLVADVHANLVALEAVLAAAQGVDGIWVMGDTVGYGPDPSDVLALLRERGATIVAGNHDRAVATGEGVAAFNRYAAEAVRLHRAWLSAEERDTLGALSLTASASGFTLCHGSLRDPIWEYVMTVAQARVTLELSATPHCCNGHTHVPALYRLDGTRATSVDIAADRPMPLTGRCLVNPGSVGQPRDGDARAAYALLETDGGTIAFRREPYDVAETQRRIRARALPAFLADRLAVGY
jgi:diadenosine tetraphosphatase ApaH/serine/threonine PP2A family protein phosphatase